MISYLGYCFFVCLARIVSFMSFSAIHRLATLLYYMLRLTRYRKNIIMSNLTRSFPNKTKAEIVALKNNYLRFMSDYIMESIKCVSISKEQVMQRVKVVNIELLERYQEQGISCIATAGHYGNWELCGLAAALVTPQMLVGVYKPLTHKHIEAYMSKVRQKWGLRLVPMWDIEQSFIDQKHHPSVHIMVGDQSPRDPNKAYWTRFLNQDTAYHFGIEKYAKQHNYPVIFCKVSCPARGFYQVELVELVANPASHAPTEITEICKTFLETIINENPTPWLWSHRRWKHKKPVA
jgi:KDO2-lipid IV(A) lauroyltransferase